MLPDRIIIAEEKVSRYLLVWQKRGDESRFLASAGYGPDTAEQLISDLGQLALKSPATRLASNQFGDYYQVLGFLTGPNRNSLRVQTIWMHEALSGITKFITIIPAKANLK